ncbi:MAG: cytidylate kinase-like family protein [Chloroflexi bacterium]|nr:cytidylate kinase-like family protein [Chloroflexota bacterium]
MIVVTISRQLGAGGRDVGRRLADELGITYVDHEIVSTAAMLAGVSEDALADADERRPTILSYIADLLARYPTAAELGIPAVEIEPALSQDTYHKMIEDVIKDVANRGSAVIVGRAGNMILRNQRWTLHVNLVAPFERRVDLTMKREGIGRPEAERRVRESDRNRAGYMRTYYKVEWTDPLNYHLTLNMGRLDLDTATNLVVDAAKSLMG